MAIEKWRQNSLSLGSETSLLMELQIVRLLRVAGEAGCSWPGFVIMFKGDGCVIFAGIFCGLIEISREEMW